MFIPINQCIKCGLPRWVPIFSIDKVIPVHECEHVEDFDPNFPLDELINYYQDKLDSKHKNLPDVYYDLVSTLEMCMESYNEGEFDRALYYLTILISLLKQCAITDLNLIRAYPDTPEELNENSDD